MNKLAVVYWSSTGNTEIMASCIAKGAEEAGAEVKVMGPADFSGACLPAFDVVAFGCPSMGCEVLEETEFDPMFSALEQDLAGKKIALFGSYGWGDGQWMRDWCARCKGAGADLFDENGLIVNETPDLAGQKTCSDLGKQLAGW